MNYAVIVVTLLLAITGCTSLPPQTATCIEGNCTNGHGTAILLNGGKYVGEFKNGYLDGYGKFTNPSVPEKVYAGQFKNDHFYGIVTFRDSKAVTDKQRDNQYIEDEISTSLIKQKSEKTIKTISPEIKELPPVILPSVTSSQRNAVTTRLQVQPARVVEANDWQTIERYQVKAR